MPDPDKTSRLSDVDSVQVGHWTDSAARTGCTVILFEKPAVASVHVSGGAPGSQETDLLEPSCLVGEINAVFLTGGSAFGLAASAGVRRWLEEKGRGFNAGGAIVPIVPSAVIFDLLTGDGSVRPGPGEGYAACEAAAGGDRREGAVGAGAGATVAKYLGRDRCLPGGLASRAMKVDGGVHMGALMVANCYGAVVDPETGKPLAAPAGEGGKPVRYLEASPAPPAFGATAIGLVVTDAALSKAEAKRVAIMAHDGLARCVSPSHTPYDGDMIFVVSTGDKKMEISRLGAWAAHMVEKATVAAVTSG